MMWLWGVVLGLMAVVIVFAVRALVLDGRRRFYRATLGIGQVRSPGKCVCGAWQVPNLDCLPSCPAYVTPPTWTGAMVQQRRLDQAADRAGVRLGHQAEPSAGRGQFWTNLGVRPELATDRDARELADYELVKQKLAGMTNPDAGKDRR